MANQCATSLPVPSRIPRYIHNLNALALHAGLAVEMTVEPYTNDPRIRLWSKWRGDAATFLAFVQPVASYRLPISRGHINIPGGAGYYLSNALVSGDVTVNGNDVLFEIDFGPPEFSISDAAGAEIVSYSDEIVYHGLPDALMALGIERSRLPLQKKVARSFHDWQAGAADWSSRRQLDGSIVLRVESPSALRRRHSDFVSWRNSEKVHAHGVASPGPVKPAPRPTHLRLVIDNERPSARSGDGFAAVPHE